jgi:site-specific recombinase XerC
MHLTKSCRRSFRVRKLLGHRDATTTMNVYSHMLPDDFDKLAAAMDVAAKGAK